MKIFIAGLLAAVLAGPLHAADKPTPRQKAKELLDNAAETIAAAKSDVQIAALFHLADNYQAIDRKKSIAFFRQAFTTAAQPPGNDSAFARNILADIVVALAGLDSTAAVELLKQIPPPASGYDNRSFAASRVIDVLLEKGEISAATELAIYMGGSGAYPFIGVSHIIAKLPAGDPQRIAVFSEALTAYTVTPDRGFHTLLLRHYKDLPAGMPAGAVQKIVNATLDRKDAGEYQPLTLGSSKGTVTFSNRTESDLFDVMPLVREIDPKRYDELVAKYGELRSALQLFPGGRSSVASNRMWSYTVSGSSDRSALEAANNRMKAAALIDSRVDAALEAAAKDPDKALDMVAGIPSPPRQAEVLAAIARSVSEADPAKARRVLDQCFTLLKDVKSPTDRIVPWDTIAEIAIALKDDQLTETAIDQLLADAADLYKADSDSDRPNRAWHEYWPSMQAFRRAVVRMTKWKAVDAAPLLLKIADPDLNLLARLTMAQALLGRPYTDFRSYGGRR